MMRKLALPAVLAIIAIGWWMIGADGPETGESGEVLAEVQVPALDAGALQGEKIFNANCATCHGTNAAGRNGAGPPLVHKIYEPGHHSDASFYLAVQNGVRSHHWPFGNMPPVEGVTQDDVTSIIVYVRALQRANGIN